MTRLGSLLFMTLLIATGLGLPATATADPPVACPDEPTDMSIVYGDLATCTLETGGDSDLFRFAGSVDEVVLIVATRTTGNVNPCIELVSPSNVRKKVCTSDSLSSSANAIALDTSLTESGQFTIVISENGSNAAGNYVVSLERLVPPSPSASSLMHGVLVADLFDNQGDEDVFFFEGKPNDIVRLNFTRTSGNVNPCVNLISPDDSRVAACASDSLSSSANSATVDAVLDQTGTYAVALAENGRNASGTYTLDFQCISGSCNTTPKCNGVRATIVGTNGDNILVGTEGRDIISGLRGNDIIYGLGDNDIICGDEGDDVIDGGDGNDRLFGGSGTDTLIGRAGNDRLKGGSDNDNLLGGDDNDRMEGGSGVDLCDGGPHTTADTATGCDFSVSVP